jgi:hypothetical protein
MSRRDRIPPDEPKVVAIVVALMILTVIVSALIAVVTR